MVGHVFISYCRADSSYVAKLVPFLEATNIPVWIDRDLDYGDRWGSVIREQVDTCGVFLPVMTPEAEESPWVAREILRAESKSRPIIPLLLAGEPFFRLADMQYEDVRDGRMPSSGLVAILRKLTEGGITPAPQTHTPQPALQPMVATVPGPYAPTAAAKADVLISASSPGRPIVFTGRVNWAVGIMVSLVVSVIVFYLAFAIGYNLSADVFLGIISAIISGLAALVGSAAAFQWRGKRPRLIVGVTGLTYELGRLAVTYAWFEFSSAEIRSGRVVAVTTPGSSLVLRPDMRGRFDAYRDGFVVCDVAKVRATESQVQQAITRFAPRAEA